MDRAEFEAYGERDKPVRKTVWWSILAAALAVGYLVGSHSSLLLGAAVTLVLIAGLQPLYLRWVRARWIKRFPELADPRVKWRPRRW